MKHKRLKISIFVISTVCLALCLIYQICCLNQPLNLLIFQTVRDLSINVSAAMLLVFFIDELNERDERKRQKILQKTFLMPLIANLQRNEEQVYENQIRLYEINEKYGLVEKPCSIDRNSIRANSKKFELNILEACSKLYCACNYDGDSDKDKELFLSQQPHRRAYGDDIVIMYRLTAEPYDLYRDIGHLSEVCEDFLKNEASMLASKVFTETDISVVKNLKRACTRYVDNLNGIIRAEKIIAHYTDFISAKYAVFDYLHGKKLINEAAKKSGNPTK